MAIVISMALCLQVIILLTHQNDQMYKLLLVFHSKLLKPNNFDRKKKAEMKRMLKGRTELVAQSHHIITSRLFNNT